MIKLVIRKEENKKHKRGDQEKEIGMRMWSPTVDRMHSQAGYRKGKKDKCFHLIKATLVLDFWIIAREM